MTPDDYVRRYSKAEIVVAALRGSELRWCAVCCDMQPSILMSFDRTIQEAIAVTMCNICGVFRRSFFTYVSDDIRSSYLRETVTVRRSAEVRDRSVYFKGDRCINDPMLVARYPLLAKEFFTTPSWADANRLIERMMGLDLSRKLS